MHETPAAEEEDTRDFTLRETERLKFITGLKLNQKWSTQGLVKGEKFCLRYLDFYFRHSQLTSPASQKSQDINKVSLLLQDLECSTLNS